MELGALAPLAGRSCLFLGGAFTIRALTEAGTLGAIPGVALGLAYALLLVFLGDRDGARHRRASALSHLGCALLIGYPLLFEASSRLLLVPPAVALALALALTAAIVTVAWRHELQLAAWGATSFAIVLALALAVARGAIDASALFLVALGIGILWLTYGRRWHALRWPVALAADLAVLLLAMILSLPGGVPEAYAGISTTAAFLIVLALPVLYLGSFASRTLIKDRTVVPFEVAQTVLALSAGFGGAVRLAHSSPALKATLGLAALVLGLACYGVAFAFVERRLGGARNFAFYTSLALGLVLLGTVLSGGAARDYMLAGFGVLSAFLGTRFDRVSLSGHAVAYAFAAFVAAGLGGLALHAWVAPLMAGEAFADTGATVVVLLTFVIAVVLLLRPARSARAPWLRFGPGLAITVLALAGVGSYAVHALCNLLGPRGDAFDLGTVASVRTGLLAVAAVLLALAARRLTASRLAWIVYALLALGGVKLVLEDLRAGRPATLLWAFALYGLGLVAASRLLRGAAAPAAAGSA